MSAGFPGLPSLNALRMFEVVARHLNFRLAAEELGLTQAAVAQQIRGLEASLEIRLFERLPRGLGLTDAGRAYSASIRSALAMIDEATRLLRLRTPRHSNGAAGVSRSSSELKTHQPLPVRSTVSSWG